MNNFNATSFVLNTNESNVSLFYEIDPEVILLAQRFMKLSSIAALVAQVVIGTLLCIGLIGNFLVIYISTTSDRVINQPVHSLLVVNLAVSDLIYLVSSAPYQISSYTMPGWIYGSFLCPAFYFLNNLTLSASIYTMCTLAILRFAGLVMPFKTHNTLVTGKNARKRHGSILIAVIWSLATILSLPAAVYYRVQKMQLSADVSNHTETALNPHTTMHCKWNDDDITEQLKNESGHSLVSRSQYSFTICMLVMTYLLPGILISVLYFIVGRELLCYMNKNVQIGRSSSGHNTEYWNITKIVFSLVVVFLICWLPYNLYLLFEVVLNNNMDRYMMFCLKLSGYCLSYLHACINPVIYSFTLASFQTSLLKTFGLQKFCHLAARCSLRKLANRRSSITTLLSRRRKSRSAEGTLDAQLSSENFPTGERYVELDLMGSSVTCELLNGKNSSSQTS